MEWDKGNRKEGNRQRKRDEGKGKEGKGNRETERGKCKEGTGMREWERGKERVEKGKRERERGNCYGKWKTKYRGNVAGGKEERGKKRWKETEGNGKMEM